MQGNVNWLSQIRRMVLAVACAGACLAAKAEDVTPAEWRTGTWDRTAVRPSLENLALARFCTLTVTNNDAINDPVLRQNDDKEVLRDRRFIGEDGGYSYDPQHCFGVGDNCVLTYEFDEAVDLRQIRFYTCWQDAGRNGFSFASVEVRANGVWTPVANSALAKYDPDQSGPLLATFGDGTVAFAEGVTGVRINCGEMDNTGTGVMEIELLGRFQTQTRVEATNWTAYPGPADFDVTDTPNMLGEPGVLMVSSVGDNSYMEEDYRTDVNDCVLTNGAFETDANHNPIVSTKTVWGAGDGATLEFSFPSPRAIGRLRVYSIWHDTGRDGVSIDRIQYKLAGEADYRELPGFQSCSFGMDDANPDPPRWCVQVSRCDGLALVDGAVALKIVFGTMETKGTGLMEVQALYPTTASWSSEPWSGALDRTGLADNLLRRASTSVSVVENSAIVGTDGEWHTGPAILPVLTDGLLDSSRVKNIGDQYALASDAVVQYDFARGVDIASLGFWTAWDAGRDGQRIAGISARFEGESEYRALPSLPRMKGGVTATDTTGFCHFALMPTSGDYLMENVRSVRINFGKQENGWAGYQELEAFGRSHLHGLIVIIR